MPKTFTIRCNNCGTEQVLTYSSYYDTEKISIEVEPYVEDHWEALSITCKNPDCKLGF